MGAQAGPPFALGAKRPPLSLSSPDSSSLPLQLLCLPQPSSFLCLSLAPAAVDRLLWLVAVLPGLRAEDMAEEEMDRESPERLTASEGRMCP